MPVKFAAPLYSVWIMRYVDLPPRERKKFPGTMVPVKGTCNGVPFRGTLVSKAGGGLRVAINARVRKAAGGVDVGDKVAISLEKANAHPMPRMPREFLAALASVPGGRLAWEERARGWRRQVLLYLTQSKDPEVRAKRARQVLRRLGYRLKSEKGALRSRWRPSSVGPAGVQAAGIPHVVRRGTAEDSERHGELTGDVVWQVERRPRHHNTCSSPCPEACSEISEGCGRWLRQSLPGPGTGPIRHPSYAIWP